MIHLLTNVPLGQHSLTSVERPSYLRSDFVNLWRHARLEAFDTLKYVIHRDFDRLYPTCLIFGERFCPTFLIIPRLIPIYSNKRLPLPSFKGCFNVSSLFLLVYSAGKRTFQWMLLKNILWMAPDHQAVYLGENYTLSLPYWIHVQYKIAILVFHTWGEGSILLFITPLLCHFTI